MLSKIELKSLKWVDPTIYNNGVQTTVFGYPYYVRQCRRSGVWCVDAVLHGESYRIEGTKLYCQARVQDFAQQHLDAWKDAFYYNNGKIEVDQSLWGEPDYRPYRSIHVFGQSFSIYKNNDDEYRTEIQGERITGTFEAVKTAVENHLVELLLGSAFLKL